MSQEPTRSALDALTEATAEHIIFTLGAATGDPKPAIMHLLRRYLAEVREQEFEAALREQQQEEQAQQN